MISALWLRTGYRVGQGGRRVLRGGGERARGLGQGTRRRYLDGPGDLKGPGGAIGRGGGLLKLAGAPVRPGELIRAVGPPGNRAGTRNADAAASLTSSEATTR